MNEALALWAVREVAVQHDDIWDVEPLYNAFRWFEQIYEGKLTPTLLVQLGHRVKPDVNPLHRFRKNNPMVGDDFPPDWERVPYLIERLCNSWNDGLMTPTELFIGFERIHPFRDGNGRAGAILANVTAEVPDDKLALSWEIYSFRTKESVWSSA